MPAQTAAAPVADRIAALDWPALTAQLDDRGFAQTEPVLDAAECAALAAQFDDGRFRSRVDMRRHRFGEGEYKYFDAPLPAVVELRGEGRPVERGDAVGDGCGGGLCGHRASSRGSGVSPSGRGRGTGREMLRAPANGA